MTRQNVTCQNVIRQNVTRQNMTKQNVTSQNVTWQNVTRQNVTRQNMIRQNRTGQNESEPIMVQDYNPFLYLKSYLKMDVKTCVTSSHGNICHTPKKCQHFSDVFFKTFSKTYLPPLNLPPPSQSILDKSSPIGIGLTSTSRRDYL